MKNSRTWIALGFILGVLVLDQALKFWVKTHMYLGQEFNIAGDWFLIHFTENEGMAFGWKLPFLNPATAKLLLSIFRIIAVCGISWYLIGLIKRYAPKGLVLGIALILAGALGNIIDSAFYGQIFSESYHREIAEFMPGEGYAGFLQGRVVDMLYFPILEGFYPDWFPFDLANKHFIFFRPIFNIADSAITVGVAIILLFSRSFFKEDDHLHLKNTPSDIASDSDKESENPAENSNPDILREEVIQAKSEES